MVDSISHLASALESARSITKEAAAVVSSKLGESSYTQFSQSLDSEQLSTYLNSRNSREVKDAMKRIIATMASGDTSLNVEYFFADVLKNITSNDPKVKRLVYIYLLRFAERDPDLALLSVNSIQKLLNDSDQELRCFAIKALCDIKIQSLIPIMIHSLKKAVTDPSALVRVEVVYGLLKLYRWRTSLDEDEVDFLDTIETLFQDLLCDSEPRVISACIILFQNAYPTKLEWLHGHFRYYCKILKQLDSWSQSALIELLIKYSKTYIQAPTFINPVTNKKQQLSEDCFSFPTSNEIDMDADLFLFLNQLLPLRYSSNPLVIMTCCNAFYQLSTPSKLKDSRFSEALYRVYSISESEGIQTTILQTILFYAHIDITLFSNQFQIFFLLPEDQGEIATFKLKILSALVNEMNVKEVLYELKYYILFSQTEQIILAAVEMLIACANISFELENHIMKWLIKIMESNNLSPNVLDSFVDVIRKLIITNPLRHMKIILKLANVLEAHPDMADNARAGLIWLFGEMTTVEFRICPDILRKLVRSYTIEGVESRNAILLFAAKLLSCEVDKQIEMNGQFNKADSIIAKMYDDIIYLAKFDDEYDVRDRARYISSIFDSEKYQIATLLFQAPKPTTRFKDNNLMSFIQDNEETIGNDIKEYFNYIPWDENVETEEGSDIRKPVDLKDYNRYKKSISSNSFISKNNISRSFAGQNSDSDANISKVNATITSMSDRTVTTTSSTPKYKLQSLDDFFSDVPAKKSSSKPRTMKTIIIEEEDTSSEEEESSSEAEETGTSDDEEETSSSDNDSSDDSI
ncbi:AP-3 complex subunit beta [Monosporozyma unispora]|nr:AP-3 complex subunit beta [Kazachstania unispora]